MVLKVKTEVSPATATKLVIENTLMIMRAMGTTIMIIMRTTIMTKMIIMGNTIMTIMGTTIMTIMIIMRTTIMTIMITSAHCRHTIIALPRAVQSRKERI